MTGPRATVLKRIAIGLALILAIWSGWTVLGTNFGSGDAAARQVLLDRVESARSSVEVLEQQSLVRATSAGRWRQLFDQFRRRSLTLEVAGPELAGNAEYVERARFRVSQAEELRNRLLLPNLDDNQRSALEVDFRTALGLASGDLEHLARNLRSVSPPSPAGERSLSVYRVGTCLLSLMVAALLLVEEIGVLRFRPPRIEPRSALPEPSPEPVREESLGVSLAEKLAGRVALRFNQLLTPINGYCELLLDSLEPGDPARNDVEEIRRAGAQLAIHSRELQAFGRGEEYERRPLDLHTWIKEHEEHLRQLAGEETVIVFKLDCPPVTVSADPRQLRRVFDAVTLNARDAMPDGGMLQIRTAAIQKDGSDTRVLVEFTDTGRGMDAETRSRLFEPLFTTKPAGRGTGLGMMTASEAVRSLGGTMEVTTDLGHGTVLRVYLPRMTESPADGATHRARAAHA